MLQPASIHVVVVDDDQAIRSMLARFLIQHGLQVTQASNGPELLAALAARPVDLIVLDVMMPGEDGLSLCRRLRAGSETPVILLTAMQGDADRVVGLELGADDYVVKPFNPRELLARIKAVLRRTAAPQVPVRGARAAYRFEGWVLDASRRRLVSPAGVLVDLTSGEFDLLLVFAEHPQRVLSRDVLLDLARGRGSPAVNRSIDIQISRLRRKLEADPHTPALIKTVRNEGYYFAADVAREAES